MPHPLREGTHRDRAHCVCGAAAARRNCRKNVRTTRLLLEQPRCSNSSTIAAAFMTRPFHFNYLFLRRGGPCKSRGRKNEIPRKGSTISNHSERNRSKPPGQDAATVSFSQLRKKKKKKATSRILVPRWGDQYRFYDQTRSLPYSRANCSQFHGSVRYTNKTFFRKHQGYEDRTNFPPISPE